MVGMRGDSIPEGYETGQLRQYDKGQMKLYKQSMNNVGPDSYLSRLAGGDESLMQEMEAPAMRQFQGTLAGISSKFSNQGMGSRRSSGFQNTTTSAASNFAQELQANRQNLRRQAIQDLHNMSSQLLDKRPYERILAKQQEEKALGGWGGFVGAAGGAAAGYLVGDPLTGAQIGANAFQGM